MQDRSTIFVTDENSGSKPVRPGGIDNMVQIPTEIFWRTNPPITTSNYI